MSRRRWNVGPGTEALSVLCVRRGRAICAQQRRHGATASAPAPAPTSGLRHLRVARRIADWHSPLFHTAKLRRFHSKQTAHPDEALEPTPHCSHLICQSCCMLSPQEATFAEHGFAPAGCISFHFLGSASTSRSLACLLCKAPVIAPPRPQTASRLILIPLCRKAGSDAARFALHCGIRLCMKCDFVC